MLDEIFNFVYGVRELTHLCVCVCVYKKEVVKLIVCVSQKLTDPKTSSKSSSVSTSMVVSSTISCNVTHAATYIRQRKCRVRLLTNSSCHAHKHEPLARRQFPSLFRVSSG